MSKVCSKCGRIKDDKCFWRRSDRPYLLRSWCIDCFRTFGYRSRLSGDRRKAYLEKNMLRARVHRKNHPEEMDRFKHNGRYRFTNAKASAKRKKCSWTISKEEYYRLINLPCDYCGCSLEPWGIGLDRVDNNIREYNIENCVPCCGRCNWVKCDHFTYLQMKKIGQVIKTFGGEK